MINNLLTKTSWKNPLRGVAAWGAGVFLAFGVSSLQAQTPAGTIITNTATVNYTNNGIPAEMGSASVSFEVGVSGALEISSARQVTAVGGTKAILQHVVVNRANRTDTVMVNAWLPAGWTTKVYIDSNGNGTVDATDPIVSGPFEIRAGESVAVVVIIDVAPAFKGLVSEQVNILARSTVTPANSSAVRDLISGVVPTDAVLSLVKTADPLRVEPGKTIHYSLTYRVGAAGRDAVNLELRDALPAGVSLIANSLLLDRAPIRNASINNNVIVIGLGNAVAGSEGVVEFDVQVNEDVTAGTQIVNEATLYQRGISTGVVGANALTQVVEPSAALTIAKQVDRVTAAAGDVLTYTISYEASGLGTPDSVVVTDVLPAGVSYVAGSLSSGEVVGNVVTARLGKLARNASGTIQFQVTIDANAEAGSRIVNAAQVDYVTRGAHVTLGSTAVVTTIQEATATLRLTKIVDYIVADAGSVLRYTIGYEVIGSGALRDVVINDVLPAGLTLIQGSTSARFAELKRGARGTIEFTARINDDIAANTRIANVATGSFSSLGMEGAATSDTAITIVVAPQLSVTKTLLSPRTAWHGDEVRYAIVVRNTSVAIPLRNIEVVDTVPAELAIEERVQRWQVAELAAGDSVMFTVSAKVDAQVTAQTTVVNTAFVKASNATGSASAELTVESGAEMQLDIRLSSELLEVSPGDIAPLVAEVHNTGWATLNDVVIELVLPEGTTYVPGSLQGADSVGISANGRLIVRLRAPLAVGQTVTLKYSIAIISPKSNILLNASTATAENRTVFSNEASISLRMQRDRAIETLTVLGNVWFDDNSNGRIDNGEKPAANVDVWSEDGAVARTDVLGKFSFSNLRPGTHVFRVDGFTVPAGYASDTTDDGLVRVRVTGWNSPRAMFGLQPLASSFIKAAMPAPMDVKPVDPDSNALLVRVAPARTDSARAASKARALLTGPTPEIFGVVDGVVSSDRKVFIGVRAEAGREVALFRGDSLIKEDHMRADGVYDFLGIPLKPGPNRLRVRVVNSWNQPAWDSVMIHVSGAPTTLEASASMIHAVADGSSVSQIRIRILDQWGVPVVNKPFLTVEADGVTMATSDAYPSALGHQVQADAQGFALIAIRSGTKVMRSAVRVSAANVHITVPIELNAAALPLMIIGVGEFGIGAASAQSFAALTARGKLDDRTALTVSVDTRRVQSGDAAFARTVDPLTEGIYPMMGDASQQRTPGASHTVVSARVQRGLDYVAFGDVQTGVTDEDVTLTRYMRSITGASGEVTTRRFKLSGFGALTSQALQQVQLRGRGVSGPYQINSAIIAGTEQIQIEVRDRDNPQHVKNRQSLTPYIDYQIDYTTGSVLLKQALPSMDPAGNPLFLVITAETKGAGENKPVWGARMQTKLGKTSVGASMINDYQGLSNARLVGVDITATPLAGVQLHGEVAHSAAGDSSGIAALVSAKASFMKDALRLNGSWSNTGNGFGNPSNLALQTTTQDLQLGVGVRLLNGEVRLDHAWQNFATQDVTRSRTTMSVRQPLLKHTELEARFSHDGAAGSRTQNSGAGELKVTWNASSRVKVWGESRNEIWTNGQNSTGNYIGAGAAVQITRDVAIEGRHLSMATVDGKGYSITNIGVRSNLATGSQAWGNYQIVGGLDAAASAAVVGLNNRWNIGRALKLNTMFERRVGIDRAPAQDPIRALPFPQQESDYWSGSVGLEYVPQNKPYRLSAKTERKDGADEKSMSGVLSGDYALNGSFAVLARQEFMRRETGATSQFAQPVTAHMSSIWGLAFRPASNGTVNALVELRWVRDQNPQGVQVLASTSVTERMIGAAELIWSPSRNIELGGRYAARRSTRSTAEFMSARGDLKLTRYASLRAEARMLDEHRTNGNAWDIAPALVLRPVQGIELSGGRRWGALRDADFAANGGRGWFLSMGVRLTESSLPTAAAFWRNRLGR